MAEHEKTILVVDDDPDTLTYLTTVLEDNGYATVSAKDGAEALQEIEKRAPDLVTLDIAMPKKSGVAVYRTLKENERLRKIPVIITTGISEDFEKFRTRDLSGEDLLYLELDGTYLRYHVEAERKEPILVATGYRCDGSRVLLHMSPGNWESYENWKCFLHEMTARGLDEPLFIVTDGNPGVLKAMEEVFPRSLKHRCQRHRLENILGKAPREVRQELKPAILESFHAADYEAGMEIGREVIARYRDRFPAAMQCMEESLEATLAVLKLPPAHHKRLRTANILERTFGEKKRRTKLSFRLSRIVPTTSWPLSSSAISRGISSGGFCRSASRVTMMFPDEASKPAKIAECWPKFRLKSTTAISGCFSRASSSASRDPSRLPSYQAPTHSTISRICGEEQLRRRICRLAWRDRVTMAASSRSSAPGFSRMLSGAPIMPISCSRAAISRM